MYIFFCPQDFDLLDIGQTKSPESTSYVIFIYAISVKRIQTRILLSFISDRNHKKRETRTNVQQFNEDMDIRTTDLIV